MEPLGGNACDVLRGSSLCGKTPPGPGGWGGDKRRAGFRDQGTGK